MPRLFIAMRAPRRSIPLLWEGRLRGLALLFKTGNSKYISRRGRKVFRKEQQSRLSFFAVLCVISPRTLHEPEFYRLNKKFSLFKPEVWYCQLMEITWVITSFNLPKLRSEEHTSELQSRGLISYAVFCLKKKKRL